MPRGVPLTPEQIAEATRVYLETGNYAAAAAAIGSDRSNVRRQLIAAGEPQRAALHALALARAERDARRALTRIRAKLEAAADAAGDAKELAIVAAQVHDNARATTQMRVAHAKLTGEHAAAAVDLTSSGEALRIYLPDER
jgi:gamma-glutamyl:cysteine ligase YbdK (ATP-grasp superfamily)